MYMLFRQLSSIRMAAEQATSLALAWLVAELFYKFGSFTLELVAFLATWFVIDWTVQVLSPHVWTRSASSSDT